MSKNNNCCNNCVPAFGSAVNSKYCEIEARNALCKAVDYIAYVRLQVENDLNSAQTVPSATTQSAILKLTRDLDNIVKLFKGPEPDGATGVVSTTANLAQYWGLRLQVSCRMVTTLIRRCYALNVNGDEYTLANMTQTDPVPYSFASDISFLEFLCCLSDNLQTFSNFLTGYINGGC